MRQRFDTTRRRFLGMLAATGLAPMPALAQAKDENDNNPRLKYYANGAAKAKINGVEIGHVKVKVNSAIQGPDTFANKTTLEVSWHVEPEAPPLVPREAKFYSIVEGKRVPVHGFVQLAESTADGRRTWDRDTLQIGLRDPVIAPDGRITASGIDRLALYMAFVDRAGKSPIALRLDQAEAEGIDLNAKFFGPCAFLFDPQTNKYSRGGHYLQKTFGREKESQTYYPNQPAGNWRVTKKASEDALFAWPDPARERELRFMLFPRREGDKWQCVAKVTPRQARTLDDAVQSAFQNAKKQLLESRGQERSNDVPAVPCFMTTALCRGLGLPDDAWELRRLRRFRDRWLTPRGYHLAIQRYYRVSRRVADSGLLASAAGPAEARRLYWRLGLPCALLSTLGLKSACLARYRREVYRLLTRAHAHRRSAPLVG